MNTKISIPPFIPFSAEQAIMVHTRKLPHRRQPGATYFITFRLSDSIPKQTLRSWEAERRTWAEACGVKGVPGSPEWQRTYQQVPEINRRAYERRFAHRYYRELDACHGSCILSAYRFSKIVEASLLFWHLKKGAVGDFVIMPNHVHLLATPFGNTDVGKWMGAIKRFTATKINILNQQTGIALWQPESYDHIVRNLDDLARIRQYIRTNPGSANLQQGKYIYSNASWMNDWCDSDSAFMRADGNAMRFPKMSDPRGKRSSVSYPS